MNSEGFNCGCTPAHHGYIDNVRGGGDFSHLAPKAPVAPQASQTSSKKGVPNLSSDI